MQWLLDRIASPIGDILLLTDGEALRALDFADYEPRLHRLLRLHYASVPEIRSGCGGGAIGRAVQAWFAGELAALDPVPVRMGGTTFQRLVWDALRRIPAGETISYGALAARIGRPDSVRAVGAANGANPVAIAVPCHRVIGSNGSLTGYGGGLDRKRWLLDYERSLCLARGRPTNPARDIRCSAPQAAQSR